MIIIGLAGKAGSGKDTVGGELRRILEIDHGFTCTKLSFAGKLKDACCLFFGWDRERLEHDFAYKEGNTLDDGSPDPACALLGLTRREVMQNFGSQAVRNGLHRDAWIIILRLAIMRGEYDDIDFGFLTDCRFKNELHFVRDMDGYLMQINRVGSTDTLTKHTEHESETDWLDWLDWDNFFENAVMRGFPKNHNLKILQAHLRPVANILIDKHRSTQ